MKHCDKIAKEAFNYLEGSLEGKKQREIKEHLSICPNCAERYEQARQIHQALHSLPKLKTSPHFTVVLHARMRQEAYRRQRFFPIPLIDWGWQVPAYVAAVFILVASGIFLDRALQQRQLNNRTTSDVFTLSATPSIPVEQIDRSAPTKLKNYVMQPIPMERLLRINRRYASHLQQQTIERRPIDTMRTGRLQTSQQLSNIRQVSAPVQF